jgi:hypothetical protein
MALKNWTYEGTFNKLNGSTGKKYYNSTLGLNLYVGENPFIRTDERFFVQTGHNDWNFEKHFQKWFDSEVQAYKFATSYMRKN